MLQYSDKTANITSQRTWLNLQEYFLPDELYQFLQATHRRCQYRHNVYRQPTQILTWMTLSVECPYLQNGSREKSYCKLIFEKTIHNIISFIYQNPN